ncbi:MAG: N-acetylmuramoyl-L-alanine amidase [Patescibacteria group bacterium]
MRVLLALIVLVAVIPLAAEQKKATQKPLYGWMIVLDPGHGGSDPGASGMFSGQRVVEDEYVYDVALRVQRIIKSMGGVAVLTIQDKKTGERSLPAQEVFPDEGEEVYTARTTVVRAGTWGLNQRLVFGNSWYRKYPKHHRAWISIHFDVVGRKKEIEGVRIIKGGSKSNQLAETLWGSFAERKWLREHAPVVQNGDRQYGLRSLHILNGGNKFQEKVLIELGNFNNTADVWRVRNPVTREAYAAAIANALARR